MDAGELKHKLNKNIEVNLARKTFIVTEQYKQDDDGTRYITQYNIFVKKSKIIDYQVKMSRDSRSKFD